MYYKEHVSPAVFRYITKTLQSFLTLCLCMDNVWILFDHVAAYNATNASQLLLLFFFVYFYLTSCTIGQAPQLF